MNSAQHGQVGSKNYFDMFYRDLQAGNIADDSTF